MLLDLPTELIVQILSYLLRTDLASCRLTCRNVFSIIRDSVDLQYHTALLAANATDNPCSSLPLSTKLEQLTKGDKAWAVLKPTFTTTIPIKHNPSGIYDLTGGVYLLGNHNRRDLHYVRLPSHADEQPEWSTINVGRTIIDMGLCVYEHDLIAVVTTTPIPGPTVSHDIELLLFEFSTCKPHPQAKKHVIHVMNTPGEKPAIGIEIVGDNLVLVLYYHRNDAKPDDKVFIFDWRTAVIKMSFAVPNDTYTGLIFLDEHTILLPNGHTNALDIFRIPSKPTLSTSPIMTLMLPQLAEGRTVGGISCRAEPNPVGASSSIEKKKEAKERAAALSDGPQEEDMFPKRGYLADPDKAICIFALRVQNVQLGQFPFGHTFMFIVARNALLDAVHTYLAKQVSGTSSGPATPVFPGFDEPSLQPFPRVAWVEWGPGVTRWFNSDSIPTRWITTTAGQRCVLIADSAPDTGFPYVVLDFNPESVRRMKGWLKARKEREKAREMRKRRDSRARAMEEARQWVETTGAATAQGHDGENVDGETLWFEPLHGEGGDEPAEYHVGLAMVDDDVPDVHPGEVEDMGPSAAGPSASTVDVHPAVDHIGLERTYSGETTPHAGNEPIQLESEAMGMDLDVDVDMSEGNASTSGHQMPSPESGPTLTPGSPMPSRNGAASTTDHTRVVDGDIEVDPDNPLEGPDSTAARRIWCVTTPEMVEPADTFAEHVEGRLAYVACASARTYPFHGVLLDEERVIGIRTDFLDRIRQIEVHHFG